MKKIEAVKTIPLGLIAIGSLWMGVNEYHVQGQVTPNVLVLMRFSVICSLQASKVKQSKKSDSNSEEGN